MTETSTAALYPADIPELIETGGLPASKYRDALEFFRDGARWNVWAIGALLALAVGHILSGIMFFFAFNWDDLSGLMKMGLVLGGIVLTTAGWTALRLDKPVAQGLGIASTILIGIVLAVFGQVYQTPAEIHTPFVLWAALSLPFALASRSAAHWTVWLLIAMTAAAFFGNAHLREVAGAQAALVFFAGFGAALAALFVVYDLWLSKRFSWLSRSWFRLFLLGLTSVILLMAFTEGVWEGAFSSRRAVGLMVSLICLAIMAGLTYFIYSRRPSVGALALATFAGAVMVGQLGVRMLTKAMGGGDEVMVILLCFMWSLAVMGGMAKLFAHYLKAFGGRRETQSLGEIADDDGVDPAAFGEAMGLPADELARSQDAASPWYIDMFLGLAGIISAALACLFFGSILAMTFNVDNEIGFLILGLIVYAGSLFARRKTEHMFARHFLNTLIVAGGTLAIGALGIWTDGNLVYAVFGLVMAALTLFLVRDRILEFLMAITAAGLLAVLIYQLRLPLPHVWMMTICTAIGAACLSRPWQGRVLSAAGTAFLFAPCVYAVSLSRAARFLDEQYHNPWVSQALCLLVLIAAIGWFNRARLRDMRPPIYVLVPLIAGIALMPLGGSSALLGILLGYILGSRTLAVIGVLFQIYFLYMFYYDLDLTLLHKSGLLFVSGLIFLALCAFLSRRRATEALS